MTQEKKAAPYRVLARKYRPRHFDELIGQNTLVRTLKNAIQSGRIAHAYMLTGVRGVGKTTTARIIARALNYTGADGKGAPTIGPTDDCDICRAIAEDRCPDVLEMDAASRTGVDDIREITDGVRYAPSVARYKVYIIDEVHMLSKNAFNALLKTLEEPPPRVIFIFATTEIRKVPVTVLSRCQRFDLKRVDAQTLQDYYAQICEKESVTIDPEALSLIARAADGSVRDGLSLLDQAIALGTGNAVTGEQVRTMLGLADRTLTLDLLEDALKGDCAKALDLMADLYRSGADPAVVLQDMLDYTHLLARLRAVPRSDEDVPLTTELRARLKAMTSALSMPALGRAWQVILKGLGEVAAAPNPQAAAEMIVIRLAYAADLPDPADLIRKLDKAEKTSAVSAPVSSGAPSAARQPEPVAIAANGGMSSAPRAQAAPQQAPQARIADMAALEQNLREAGHLQLAGEIYHAVHPVKFEQGRIELRPQPQVRPNFASDLSRALQELTGARWVVSISGAAGAPTLAEQKSAAEAAAISRARKNPVVAQVLALFPGAEITITDK